MIRTLLLARLPRLAALANLGVQGINDFRKTAYDGPCPPFNDAIAHRYFFRLFALDVAKLDLPEGFTAAQALAAMQGHVLDEVAIYGSYGLNPALD